MPGRRTVIAGGAGILTLTALGYRAWDRGAFAGASGPAYAPWEQWRGNDLDGKRRPLRAAILAASPHNTQPWLLAISPTAISIYADRTRHLGAFDPFRREMHLGVGCAIENLVRAGRAFGMAIDVQPAKGRLELSPAGEPIVAARMAFGSSQPWRDPLFDAIPRRHTNRGPYREQSLASERLSAFVDPLAGPDVRVALVVDGGARREMAALIVEATKRIIEDPEMSMDSARWIRLGRRDVLAHRDGVTIDTAGTNRAMTIAGKMLPDLGAAATDRFWLEATRDVQAATAPAFGMVLVRDRLDMVQAIAAGRAWQQLHLVVTDQGLAAQPLNQPVEMIDRHQMLGRHDQLGPALARLAHAANWEPTFVFRLGYALREAPRSPRRPLEAVTLS
jgi:nitroreductase